MEPPQGTVGGVVVGGFHPDFPKSLVAGFYFLQLFSGGPVFQLKFPSHNMRSFADGIMYDVIADLTRQKEKLEFGGLLSETDKHVLYYTP